MMVNYDEVVKIVKDDGRCHNELKKAGVWVTDENLIDVILIDLNRLNKTNYADEEEMLKVIRAQNEYIERLEITIKTLMEVIKQ